MSYISKNDILKHVSIVDVADDASIDLEGVSSGKFEYRCTCPSKNHKGGTERTKSCYINSGDNNFYCFGCNAGYNVIDFYMLCNDCSFSDAMSNLRTMIDADKITSKDSFVSKRSNLPILIELYSLFRKVPNYSFGYGLNYYL